MFDLHDDGFLTGKMNQTSLHVAQVHLQDVC